MTGNRPRARAARAGHRVPEIRRARASAARQPPPTPAKRDLLSIADLRPAEIAEIFAVARRLKADLRTGRRPPLLAGKTLAMIFEKPSLRTRVTFETGITQLGGSAIYLAPWDIRLGEREAVGDIARNLARWVDLIVARTFKHEVLLELAEGASIPVINGLSDLLHPCQVLADCFTLEEARGSLGGLRVVFVGDGNNMVHSWMEAAARLGFHFTLACPPRYAPDRAIFDRTRREAHGTIAVTHAVDEAVRGADVIYTDVWTSMGQEGEAAQRRAAFRPYQVNRALVERAKPDVLVMHCLPAHRGDEITDEVLDGPRSIVLEQAENRLHVQKGIMVWLLHGAAAAGTRGAARPTPSRPPGALRRQRRAAAGTRRRGRV